MIKFGPAGNDIKFYEEGYKRSYEAPAWLFKLGLNAFEYSFGRGIMLNDSTATTMANEFNKYNIAISVHAPYYINLATPDEINAQKSYNYIINSAKKVKLLGGNRVVVHPGSQGKLQREEAVSLIKQRLHILAEKLRENNLEDVLICLETMGKSAQIGTYEEIIDFCKISKNYYPTFDFGHINSLLGGALKSKADYMKILNFAIREIGFGKVKNCHIHFSKIQYSQKGEIKHLTLEDKIYGPEFKPLAECIKELELTPVVICESDSIMAQDAVKLKEIYNSL